MSDTVLIWAMFALSCGVIAGRWVWRRLRAPLWMSRPPVFGFSPRIRIEVPRAEAIFTRVWVDGIQLAANRVWFDTGDAANGLVVVHLEIIAEAEVEGDFGLVISGIDPRSGATFEAHR